MSTCFFKLLIRYVLLGILLALPATLLYLDVHWLGNDVDEDSLTEISQDVILILLIALFTRIAFHYKQQRGFAILVIGLFLCMLIREQNNFLNDLTNNLWPRLVAITAISSMLLAVCQGRQTWRALAAFMARYSGHVVIIGLLLLLIHSRLFGIRSIWEAMLQDAYVRVAKNAVEESTETMAYMLIFYGSMMYWRELRHADARTESDTE